MVCEKTQDLFRKTQGFLQKLKEFGEKTQQTGSRSLHLAPKKVVNQNASSMDPFHGFGVSSILSRSCLGLPTTENHKRLLGYRNTQT